MGEESSFNIGASGDFNTILGHFGSPGAISDDFYDIFAAKLIVFGSKMNFYLSKMMILEFVFAFQSNVYICVNRICKFKIIFLLI